MAKWRPRVSPAVESELQSLGPYVVAHSGVLTWVPAPGIEWPWGPASLQFHVDYRGAGDADFLRLLDAWRQLRERWEEAAAMLRRAVLQGWRWARENLPAGEVADSEGSSENVDIERVFRQVGGCGLCLSTSGLRQVNITAYVDIEWDPEHGVEVDLIEPRLRDSWSFL